MQQLELLVIHCTFTPEGREVSKKDIEQWHLVENGWRRVGYSDMIHINGSLENLIPFNQDSFVDVWEISNGAKGFNSKARHVVYVGGAEKNSKLLKAKDTRTFEQWHALTVYCYYMVLRHPNIKICGHNQLDSKKECPSFDVPSFLRDIGIDEKNIYKNN